MMSFTPIEVDSSALEYARKAGIELLANRGVDPSTLNAMREAGLAKIRMSARSMLTGAIQNARLGFSGADTGIEQKAADAASASIFSQAAEVEDSVTRYNEERRQQAVRAMLNLYSTLDQMKLQADIANEQLKQNEGSLLGDIVGGLGAIGTFLGGAGPVYGMFSKKG